MVCTNKNAAKENPPPKSRPEFMLKWRANMLRLMLIIVCMPLYPFSSYNQASGTSTMTDLAVFAPIALYSIVEETPGPQTLGDLIPILLSTEFASANSANASQLSSIVFFPSTQPFSEYFQLHRRTRTEHGREFLTTCFLELQKSIDLEEVCKIRLYGEDCAKTAQTVNIAMRGRTCCCDTSLLFCSLQLQLAMLGSHSTLPILDRFSQLQRQESFPVFLVEVRIFDANENSPTYSQAEYSLRVTEGPESTTIFQLPTARDADMGENGRITYFLTDIFVKLTTGNDWQRCPSCASLFHVIQKPAIKDSSSGRDLLYLQVNAELDREKENAYRLLVLAKDAGRPIQKTGTLYVSIEVLDSNDMKPEFSHLAYNFLIDENVPRGTFVGRVEAKDKDIGMNARVSYSLRPKHRGPPDNLFYSSANMNTPFSIHAATGVLTVNGSLDRERQTEYTVYVEATDHGSPAKSSESIVHITVLDLNDNSPNVQIRMLDTIERVREINTANTNTKEIREFEITLPENLPVDVILAEIDAFDPDVGANGSVLCVLLSDVFLLRPLQAESVTIFGAAEINSTLQSNHIIKYCLHLSKPIDFEQQKFFRLVLTCYDSGTPFQRSTRSIINVFIRDENDNPPVLGDAEVITPAWKVEKWVLNSWKGEQTELIEAMKMILTENLLLLCLPKWLATKQPFLRIPATDRDAENNAKLAYHLSFFENVGLEGETYNAELFDADALTGHIFLKRNLEFVEQNCLLKIKLTVCDFGLPSLNSTLDFYILVTDENRNAPSIKILNFGLIGSLSPFQAVDVSSGSNRTIPYIPFYIPKVRKFGMVIGEVQATDMDAGFAGKISYDISFKHANPQDLDGCMEHFQNPIEINKNSGILSISASQVTDLNACMLLATVSVWDQGLPQKKAQVFLKFQEFDLTSKFPKIHINENFLISQNQTTLAECNQWNKSNMTFQDCTSAFEYNLPLLQKDNDTLSTASKHLPFTFLTVENEHISGLFEGEIDLENCSYAEYSHLTGALKFSSNSGQLQLVRPLNSADSNQIETFHLVITDIIWPSIPRTVLRLSVQVGNIDNNFTHFHVTLTVGVTGKTYCPRSIQTENLLDGTKTKSENFKIYMLAVWAAVCILCLLLVFETIILKRTRRDLLPCRRFFRTNKKPPLSSSGLVYEGQCESTRSIEQITPTEESSNSARYIELGKSETMFGGLKSCYVLGNPRAQDIHTPYAYAWKTDDCSTANRPLCQLHPQDLQPGTIYLHVLPSSTITENRNNEWASRRAPKSLQEQSFLVAQNADSAVFSRTDLGLHGTRKEKHVPVDIIVHNNLSAEKLVKVELCEGLCSQVNVETDERLW